MAKTNSPTEIVFTDRSSQISYDPLDYDGGHEQALAARNARLRELRKGGRRARGHTLTGQLRKYSSFGVPDGSVRNIYLIEVLPYAEAEPASV